MLRRASSLLVPAVLVVLSSACGSTAPPGKTTGSTTGANNCGGCGSSHACATGDVCSNGHCQAACGSGTSKCGNSCVDLSTDASNCGTCAHACPSGQSCSNRACVAACPAGQTKCGTS